MHAVRSAESCPMCVHAVRSAESCLMCVHAVRSAESWPMRVHAVRSAESCGGGTFPGKGGAAPLVLPMQFVIL